MCSFHSILECCVTFSGVKLSIRSFVLFAEMGQNYSAPTELNVCVCCLSSFQGVSHFVKPDKCF